jgi:hypothetical protein
MISHEVQLVLFGAADLATGDVETVKTLKAQLESIGWWKSGETVCMVEECFVPLEVWQRRRKGKPPEIQHLERNTMTPHEVSAEGKHQKRNQK